MLSHPCGFQTCIKSACFFSKQATDPGKSEKRRNHSAEPPQPESIGESVTGVGFSVHLVGRTQTHIPGVDPFAPWKMGTVVPVLMGVMSHFLRILGQSGPGKHRTFHSCVISSGLVYT